MTPMSREQRRLADQERPTATCQRLKTDPDHTCDYLEVSHPLGRKHPQKRFQWIWSCHLTHQGRLKNQKKDLYLVYSLATEEQLKARYPKSWQEHAQKKIYLTKLYGRK